MSSSHSDRNRMLAAAIALVLSGSAFADLGKLDSRLSTQYAQGERMRALILPQAVDVPAVRASERGAVARRAAVVATLKARAEASQAGLLQFLAERGIKARPFWVGNFIAIEADAATIAEIAARDDVRALRADQPMRSIDPKPSESEPSSVLGGTLTWGVDRIDAELAWAAGVNGFGVVVAGQDTGYDWDHEALAVRYRGWNGIGVNHNYNWRDAIHEAGSSCGADSAEPCDDHGHGTHTMGTMVGQTAVEFIGVAPGAEWIGCRNMNSGNGTPSTYSECFEFFIAPTDATGQNPDPAMAPDVINNSWGCPPSEGCTVPEVMQEVVENTRAAGIVVVVSAGNDGSSCETITTPAAIYQASFVVGSTTSAEAISGFSSRGPVGSMNKPDVVAPGSSVRSSFPDNTYGSISGTSMAGPHVAGTVALVIDANETLRARPTVIERIIRETTVPIAHSQTCGGVTPGSVPDPVQGYGRISALAAVQRALDTIHIDGAED